MTAGIKPYFADEHPKLQQIRHGYSLDDLDKAARTAVKTAWARAADYRERYEAAWLGVAERLMEADSAPTWGELIFAGQKEVNAHVDAYRHDHGLPTDGVSDPDSFRVSFQRYWWLSMRAQPSHAHGVEERTALTQIMATLAAVERSTLLALAITGDYAQAAAMLDMSYQTFHSNLSRARRKFFALWHEGEAPSRMWGRDRRKWRQDVDEVADHRTAIRRHRRGVQRRARAAS